MILRVLKENERHIGAGALLLGFLVDTITLSRIDLLFDNLILVFYLTLATVSILIAGKLPHGKRLRITRYLTQYAFGGVFSGFIIFYSQSAGFLGSWLFLLIFLGLLLGNEFFRARYSRPSFQMGVLFVAFFSYTIFLLPILTGKIGALMFVLSGIVSVMLISLVVLVDRSFTPSRKSYATGTFKTQILLIFILFNVLYFTNVIPPIPLSLQELTIAHDVKRLDDGSFVLKTQKRPWYQYFNTSDISYESGTALYSFTSVFAPTRITTRISHQWYFFDEATNRWVAHERISFFVSGGRDGGYRGYSFKSTLTEGRFRVDVLTEQNKLLGRKTFTLIPAPDTPPLRTQVR